MGFIADFLGGAADAGVELSKQALLERAERERDEAQFRRKKSLERLRQKFQTSEREASQKFTAGENEKTRTFQSSERVATEKYQSSEKVREREYQSYEKERDRESSEYIAETRNKGEKESATERSWQKWWREALTDIDEKEMEINEATGEPKYTEAQIAEMRRRVNERYDSRGPNAKPPADATKSPKAGGGKKFTTKEDYIKAALELNKGNGTEAEIRAAAERAWNARNGGGDKTTTPKQAQNPAPKPGNDNDNDAAREPDNDSDDKGKKPQESKQETLARLEAKLKADDELKAPGSGGILGRAIRAKRMPLGIAERRTLERRIEKLRKEINAKNKKGGK